MKWALGLMVVVLAGCGSADGDQGSKGAGGAAGAGGGAGSGGTGGDFVASVPACDTGAPASFASPKGVCVGDWCYESQIPFSGQMDLLAGSGSDDIWVTNFDGVGHWDGSEWRITPELTGSSVDDIWSASATDAWAVMATAAMERTLFRFDGAQWSEAKKLPTAVTGAHLHDLDGTGAADVWLVGPEGRVEHFDGTSWTAQTPFTTKNLSAVTAIAAADVWAGADDGTLFHFDGSSWTERFDPALVRVRRIWAPGADDVWVLGDTGSGSDRVIRRWNGAGFVDGPDLGFVSNSVDDLSGTSANDVWMATPFGMYRWDGSALESWYAPGDQMLRVWGDGSGTVWALGLFSTHRFESGEWSPVGAVGNVGVSDIWGLAWNDVWAVGTNGTVVHFDGQRWRRRDVTVDDVEAVWGASSDAVWIGTDAGRLLFWDGQGWKQEEESLGASGVEDLWGIGARDLWVLMADEVGVSDVVRWVDGEQERFTLDMEGWAIWASGPRDAWVVGRGGVRHFDGNTWSKVTAHDTIDEFQAVWGRGPDDVYALGWNTLVHWDGAAWSPVEAPGLDLGQPTALAGCGSDQLWVLDKGSVGHLAGSTWSITPLLEPRAVAVWPAGPDHYTVVGDGGLVLRHAR